MVGLLAYAGCTGRGNEDSRAVKGSSTEKTAKYVVGFSNGFSDNSWRTEMLASLRREAERYTDLELIIMDGQGDINKQVADLETLIARRVDAIMLIPNSALAVTPVLKRAMVLGIKVLHFNLPLDDPDSYTIYVGPDERERGRRWARWRGLGAEETSSFSAVYREIPAPPRRWMELWVSWRGRISRSWPTVTPTGKKSAAGRS
jgi:ABC-type sugar transport system substrate-binding protein